MVSECASYDSVTYCSGESKYFWMLAIGFHSVTTCTSRRHSTTAYGLSLGLTNGSGFSLSCTTTVTLVKAPE